MHSDAPVCWQVQHYLPCTTAVTGLFFAAGGTAGFLPFTAAGALAVADLEEAVGSVAMAAEGEVISFTNGFNCSTDVTAPETLADEPSAALTVGLSDSGWP